MKYGVLKAWVSALLVFGHLVIFLASFSLFALAPISFPDVLQLALTSVPVLGASAALAFNDILRNPSGWRAGRKVSTVFFAVSIGFPIAMYLLMLTCLLGIALQWESFNPQNIKIAIASIEGFFGVYVGAIAASMFGGDGADNLKVK